jgi:hypothetical protein
MKIMKHRLVYINLVTAKIMVTGERGAILLKKEKQLLYRNCNKKVPVRITSEETSSLTPRHRAFFEQLIKNSLLY